MKIIPIKDFENDYGITDNGDVIHLFDKSIKTPHYMRSYNIDELSVDLYKDGESLLTRTIKYLILVHFFEVDEPFNWIVDFIDGNKNNLSPYNLEITRFTKNVYVNYYGMTKPTAIYGYNENGKYMINQDELESYNMKISELSDERNKVTKQKRKESARKLPLKGTIEREEYDKKTKIRQKIEGKLKSAFKTSKSCLIPFDITYEDVMEVYETQNETCPITSEKIELDSKFKFILLEYDKGFTKNNIMIGNIGKRIRKTKINEESKTLKNKQIVIRFDENEYMKIKELATEKKITVSELIRESCNF